MEVKIVGKVIFVGTTTILVLFALFYGHVAVACVSSDIFVGLIEAYWYVIDSFIRLIERLTERLAALNVWVLGAMLGVIALLLSRKR